MLRQEVITLANGESVWVCFEGNKPVPNPRYLPPKPRKVRVARQNELWGALFESEVLRKMGLE
jgi:hypothetical protein